MTILNGMKILDFSAMLPGPFATMMFADLGADVIHVESAKRMDIIRIMPPYDDDRESYVHQHLNRSKKSLSLNLKSDEATEIIYDLIKEYDIVIEGFRPGVMKRLKLDYETLKAINSKIIYCSITGYGQTGPYAQQPGHDNNYLSVAGVLDHSRREGQKPVSMGIQIADIAGGSMHAAVGVLAAALHREKTGEGNYIDVSMTDAAFALNAMHGAQYFGSGRCPEPEKELLNGGTYYDFYQTKDGRYFSVGSLEPQFRKRLCEALGIPELIDNTFNDSPYTQKRFKEAICDAFKTKTYDQWLHIFNADFDGCVEPVLSFEEACSHPQLVAREMIVDVPKADGSLQCQIGSPLKITGMEPNYQFVGTKIGAHTDEILSEMGLSAEKIATLRELGVLK